MKEMKQLLEMIKDLENRANEGDALAWTAAERLRGVLGLPPGINHIENGNAGEGVTAV